MSSLVHVLEGVVQDRESSWALLHDYSATNLSRTREMPVAHQFQYVNILANTYREQLTNLQEKYLESFKSIFIQILKVE